MRRGSRLNVSKLINVLALLVRLSLALGVWVFTECIKKNGSFTKRHEEFCPEDNLHEIAVNGIEVDFDFYASGFNSWKDVIHWGPIQHKQWGL